MDFIIIDIGTGTRSPLERTAVEELDGGRAIVPRVTLLPTLTLLGGKNDTVRPRNEAEFLLGRSSAGYATDKRLVDSPNEDYFRRSGLI